MRLLLTDIDGGRPVDDALPTPPAWDGGTPPVTFFATARRDALDLQKWCVLIAEGDEHLIDWVRALCEHRWAEAMAEPRYGVLTVQPGMDGAAASAWMRSHYGHIPRAHRPRYVLVLGDLDRVSLATQQALMRSAFVGRLCCEDEAGYRAYADKVIAAEAARAQWTDQPRLLIYTARDEADAAIETAYADLVRHSYYDAKRDTDAGWQDLHRFGHAQAPWHGPTGLLAQAEASHPSVLLSVTHGASSVDAVRQRAQQGALVLDPDGPVLWSADDVGDRAFLPGGLWFLSACFGGGTPDASAFHPWLERLQDSAANEALRYLAAAPFIARLPQRALGNARGPAAIVAHVDLAWAYGYHDPSGAPDAPRKDAEHSPYYDVVRAAALGSRFGNAVASLQDKASLVATDLAMRYGGYEQGAPAASEEAVRAWMWMQYLDLTGYILLGDPAAQLPTAAARDVWQRERALSAQRTATRGPSARAKGEAVLAVLAGETVESVAARMDIAPDDLRQWQRTFCDAGLAALA